MKKKYNLIAKDLPRDKIVKKISSNTDMSRNLVEYAISESKTLTVKTVSYLSRERDYIDRVLKQYLDEIEKPFLVNQVAYCLHELAGNANRANAKRVYFKEQGLDIHCPGDYTTGISTFRQDTFSQIERFHTKQKAAGLYIKIDFQLKDETLRIRVRNNTPLTEEEKTRIHKKFETMKNYSSIPEAYEALEDYSEGAGLGLVMILQLLNNLGFGDDALNVDTNGKETIATLFLKAGNELYKD
ncbi:ATP-binding protein [Oceanispirochaeta crateris]|uniref:ATP-binding protein n=1 Tax=Oceanispirochaeta crateris TaxID=2518645 RepID=A0A5C1QNL8_9SPIO|nr:sensor histidine kinase [Oceanispirochaeta crateris]QEN09127.1 ATP-binding protein [Oceanispirochaeta crateris]